MLEHTLKAFETNACGVPHFHVVGELDGDGVLCEIS